MVSELTIVVPYRNREALLPRTLNSIAESERKPAELILVDNGSSDGSAAVCAEWAGRQDPATMRVRLLEEPVAGAATARNRGLQAVTTPWVYFFDSDDAMSPDFLTDLAPVLREDDADMIAVPTRMKVEGKLVTRRFKPTADPSAQILWSHLNTQGMIFNTQWLREIGGWNAEAVVWNDWELGLRALLHQPRLKWMPRRAYHIIYVHPDSLTGTSFGEKKTERLAVMDMACRQISACPHLDERQRRRAMKALFLRLAILAGRLRQEGQKTTLEVGQRYESGWPTRLVPFWQMKAIGWLTAHRVPGTWWLAWKML